MPRMGAKPPEGAVVLFDGKSLEGWVKRDGKTPADWPVADGIVTVGHGDILTQKRFGDFQAPSGIQRPLHAQGPRTGPRQQRRLSGREPTSFRSSTRTA